MLRYASRLAAAVDAKQELAPGSQEEVEIRGVTVVSIIGVGGLGSQADGCGLGCQADISHRWLWAGISG